MGKSGSVSCGVTALFPGSWCTQGFVCALQESVSPVLCKFWQLYGGVNGGLLQEGLCHTQGCCTQSPCPCGRSLPPCTSTGDPQTQFWLSLCGVSGSWCVQGLFEPFERLWWEWGLILNVNLPLLLSCWGFSFALGCGVSPHGRSSKAQPLLLTLDVGYLLTATTPDLGPFTSQILHPSFTSQIFLHGTLLGCKTLEALKKKKDNLKYRCWY